MSTGLGINIASLRAQRGLSIASSAFESVFEKLSSGQRINRPSDDPAGLHVVSSLNLDSRVYSQATRNINDGISLLNIADAALNELSGVITRVRELANQAASESLSVSQRKALNAEAQALEKEFTRISNSTKFNGIGIFDGTLSAGLRLQAGYGEIASINALLGGKKGAGTAESLTTYVSTPTQSETEVATGDINNDGNLDIVISGASDALAGIITVRLGYGDGTFGSITTYSSSGISSNSVVLADVNNDSVLDVIASGNDTFSAGYTAVFIGNGDGTFGAASVLTTGITGSSGLEVSDLNGDGFADIVNAGNLGANGGVSIRLGNGDGTFGSATTLVSDASSSTAVTVADLNRDGIQDIITSGAGGGTGSTSVLIGNGNGTFQTSVNYTAEAFTTYDLAIGDLNGDGILDLATTGINGVGAGFATIRLGVGNGTFGGSTTYTTSSFHSRAVSLADINGDGSLDLVAGGMNGGLLGEINVRLGNGDGTFASSLYSASMNARGAYGLSVSDINNDGVLDFVTAGIHSIGDGSTSVRMGSTREGLNPILPFSLATQAEARQALEPLRRKQEQVSQHRGQIGALMSRLATAHETVQLMSESLRSAWSRITDVDVAEEAANLAKYTILKESATAMLAQANQQSKVVLGLLSIES